MVRSGFVESRHAGSVVVVGPDGELVAWAGDVAGAIFARSSNKPLQAVAMLRGAERLWFGIAPEGTRKPVERWKTGFWKIAKGAGVPVLPAYFHYGRKVIGIGPLLPLTEDMQADIERIRAWFRGVSKGRNHDA